MLGIWLLLSFVSLAFGAGVTHNFEWVIGNQNLSPDGEVTREVITINNEWPAPQIRINKGDRVVIHVINNLKEDTSLHFHGIFQRNSSHMDGATMISQCPIPPGGEFTYDFTVPDQTGTYWYHSHSVAQYGDGLRGVFIVEDGDENELYDGDMAIMLADWYHTPSAILVEQMFAQGSRGGEPSIKSGLFNETERQSLFVQPDKTYLIRLVNGGMSATQYFYIEDHTITIVEVDGVKVDPVEVEAVQLATGQRYNVVLKTKSTSDRNYGVVQITNIMMNKKYTTNWLVYGEKEPEQEASVQVRKRVGDLNFYDDINLRPLGSIAKLPEPDHRLTFVYSSDHFNQYGTKYYTMNSHPHLSPKVPTLHTVFSANNGSKALDPKIYGEGTNAFILQKDEIVEIVLNSEDHMRHPFHLHGHNFQILTRGAHVHYREMQESQFPEYPAIRDTVNVPGSGHVVLRFKAQNPGVWFFHCHTEWHAVQGLGVVFIEAPDVMLETQTLPQMNKDLCVSYGAKPMGNAAGNDDLDDLTGEVKWPVRQQDWKPTTEETTTTIMPSTDRTTFMPTKTAVEQVKATTDANDITTTSTHTKATKQATTTTTTSSRAHKGMGMRKKPHTTTNTTPMVATMDIQFKGEALLIYLIAMVVIAGIFAYLIQRGMNKLKKKIPLGGINSEV